MAYNLDLFALVGKLNGGSWYLSSPVVLDFSGRKKKVKIFWWYIMRNICEGLNERYLFTHLFYDGLFSARYSAYIVLQHSKSNKNIHTFLLSFKHSSG